MVAGSVLFQLKLNLHFLCYVWLKTERTLEINFTTQERAHYKTLEDAARSFYVDFKAMNDNQLSRHCLMLTQKLNQSRIACSGGKYPLEETKADEDDLDVDNIVEEEEGGKKKRKPRKMTKYSDFVFTSKLNTLIRELKRIRDEDPSCKSIVAATDKFSCRAEHTV